MPATREPRFRTDFVASRHDLLVAGLQHIGWTRFVDAKRDGLGAHHHPGAYELCYVKAGTLHWCIGDRAFTVAPGHLYLTLPDEVHGGQDGVMDPCDLYWVSFTLDRRRGSLGFGPAEARLIDDRLRAVPDRTCRVDAGIATHWDRILAELAHPGPLSAATVEASLILLLRQALAAYATAENGPMVSPRIAKVLTWMRTHFDEDLRIEGLAEQASLSPSQFRQVFRAEVGMSPQDHLTHLRIEAAKTLLRETARSVTDIALACGFTTSQYFATAFRRATGFTPRAYRNG